MKQFFCVFMLITLLSACSAKKGGETAGTYRTVTDIVGREVNIPAEISSIVCVGTGALRWTTYVGAADLVAGVEQAETQPAVTKAFHYVNAERFINLPVIGDYETTYGEEVIKLSPDLIVGIMDTDSADALQAKTGIPVLAIEYIDSMFDDNCYQTITLMGNVYNRQERARELYAYIKGLEADLDKRTGNITNKPAVYAGGISFRTSHGIDGTEAHYAPLYMVGADNLADRTGQKGFFIVDAEQILNWDPDIIFLDLSGLALIKDDYEKRPDFYRSLKAVRTGRVYSQIPFRYSAVNAEIALADTYYAGTIIYPEAFADIDPVKKADEIFTVFLGVDYYETLKAAGYEFGEIKLGN